MARVRAGTAAALIAMRRAVRPRHSDAHRTALAPLRAPTRGARARVTVFVRPPRARAARRPESRAPTARARRRRNERAERTAMATRRDDAARPPRENVMVFVRNLPYDCDDDALEATFGEHFGPIKECWVAREKGSTTHRGFGYVKFAIADDAREACEKSGKVEMGGRKLAIVMARRKEEGESGKRSKTTAEASGGERAEAEAEAEAEKKKRERKSADAVKRERVKRSAGSGAMATNAAVRTVVLGGVRLGGEIEGVDAEAAKELARACGEVETITEPCPDDVMKLAKIREDGCKRGAMLVVYKDEETAREAVRALHGKSPKAKSHRRRKSKDTDAKDADEPKEYIWARALGGEGSKPKQWRVIVRNLSFKATKESIREALSAAGFVWDINVPTDFHDKPKGFAFVTYTCKSDADKAVSDCNGVEIAGRQVAVDIALGKSKYQAEQNAAAKTAPEVAEDEPKTNVSQDDDDRGDDRSSSSSSDDEDEETQEKNMMSRLLGKVIAEAEPARPERKPIAAKKQVAPDVKASNSKDGQDPAWQGRKGVDADSGETPENVTVFVRNLPLEATWQQLKEKMMKFGKVTSCRVVKDKTTGKHTGNAFVDFTNANSANAAVEAGESESAGIFVAGRPITVALALSKAEAADMMARQGAKYRNANKHRDNRNLYLAQEGDIHEASAAADGVSKSDIDKRRRSNEERQLKLKNPNFFISRTRLSVRNIPPEIDSKTLKKMFIEAVQQRATQAVPKVLHAKLLYDNEKMDENGKPRSKGMGFIEFTEHEHALTALRALNNNPNAFSRARRPIVEFSIEDARAVRKLELKAKQREGQQKRAASKDEDKPRGAEQAAKRVAKKEKAAGVAPKRPRDDANRAPKPTSRADADGDAKPRDKRGTKQQPSKPSGGAPKMLQRAAEAKREDRNDARRKREREPESVKPKKKPHGADKRDRTDDLIDRYFSADAKKGGGGLKDWL